MTDEQKQRYKKNYYNNYKYGRLLLNKTRQIVYFNYFVSVFHVLLSNK